MGWSGFRLVDLKKQNIIPIRIESQETGNSVKIIVVCLNTTLLLVKVISFVRIQ